ncbi:MAG TPA: ATP-binding protein [Lacibacter sp.]|nr:ATP-binding protein [Lacibacter sp.]HMO87828.1 ATP-binding protein [Lacibacter sp.]HMP87764.1 ATP-binding protein [Lacibacter sp.]
MVQRILLNRLVQQCFQGKILLLMGGRQVGKTTLLKQLTEHIQVPIRWFNADEADYRAAFTAADTSSTLLQLVGAETRLVIIDEAQQIPEIGKKLKLLYDTAPDLQIIATGSSAFDLNNRTQEPLTGRKTVFQLYPISYQEFVRHSSLTEARRMLQNRLLYGSYPDVINNPGHEKEVLLELTNSYLYKDLLQLDGIRKSSVLQKLLQALALQTGSEVHYHELAQTIGNIQPATVEKYIELLEQSYVLHKLPAFSRNLRNEIKKGKKYYFLDNGIRNALLSNFAPPELRSDKGALLENFLVTERLKYNHYRQYRPNTYFWRTHDQAEIDYLEENDGQIQAFEFKWKAQKTRFPSSFLNSYPVQDTRLIHVNGFEEFIGGKDL